MLHSLKKSQVHQVMSLRYLVRILFACLWLHVMYCCCCLRPCFVRVSSTVCHVLLLLSSTMLRTGLVDCMSCIVVAVFDHALWGSRRQYVMYCCCCLRPCFVQVLLTVCHVLLLLSSTMLCAGLVDSMPCIVVAAFDHASCGSC